MGHVHLRVADVGSTVAFYRDVLGMGLMAQLGEAAAFLSAGGYHHHVGGNTWESRGAAPAGPGRGTLRLAPPAPPPAHSGIRPSAPAWPHGSRTPDRSRRRGPTGCSSATHPGIRCS